MASLVLWLPRSIQCMRTRLHTCMYGHDIVEYTQYTHIGGCRVQNEPGLGMASHQRNLHFMAIEFDF